MQRKLFPNIRWLGAAAASVAVAAIVSTPSPVEACGGFFCSATNPVNQAAEQIIFSQNGDGTVTAVIQIMYEGPSQKFAWVLPVPGTPTVAVSSDQAFVALKQATNPQYNLTTTYDPSCPQTRGGVTGSASVAPGVPQNAGPSGVTVQASGAIGPYDYDVISVDPKQTDRAQVAVDWLTLHSYDVGDMGPAVLRPYLDDDLNLIAFKLTKGTSAGSIRPVMLTYTAALPSIPIRPTAVAANDDMGVLVWVLSDARAIPQNYKALELNEALIDSFNANNTYNKVVSKAADEAMGQGFVTEYAQKEASLKAAGVSIFSSSQQMMWDQFQAQAHTDAMSMIRDASNNWGSFDGFDDALAASVTLPTTIALTDFKRCVACYLGSAGVVFNTTTFLTKLYEMVIKPLADTQTLLDSRPYVTRLYTTMSAAEMTLDPAFDFNSELKDVSNIHMATRTIECSGTTSSDPTLMPWRVVLPQGDTVHGTMAGTWPIQVADEPAALKILQYGKSGQGKVVDDQTAKVTQMLKQQNAGASSGGSVSITGTGGKSGTTTGSAGSSASSGNAGASGAAGSGTTASSGGCAVNGQRPSSALSLLLSLAAVFARRRRATQG